MIQNQLMAEEENVAIVMENCLMLYKNGIKKANQTLSAKLLTIITFSLIGLVSSLYTTISLGCFTKNPDGYGSTISTVGYIIYSATFLWTVCQLNALSQRVSDQVIELREQLTNLCNSDPNIEQSKTKACQLLHLFHGFDCSGYVTLGRPVLTSILTTVLTYTIILVQFKESESPQNIR